MQGKPARPDNIAANPDGPARWRRQEHSRDQGRRQQSRPCGCPALLPGACIGSFCQKVSERSVSPHFIIE
ncbi:MAG: hypothetical protein JW999_05975 [Methanotrichaceae archaeon]|nr:hypothetical protein [Methanotrichaceae archaeon]